MATLSSKYVGVLGNNPPQRVEQGDLEGRIHSLYDEFQPSAAVVANGTIIEFAQLPPGARVVDVTLAVPDQGTTGSCKVGWKDNGVDGALDNGFMASVNLNAADIAASMDAYASGRGKKFSARVTPIVTLTAATDASSTTSPWKLFIRYSLD